MIFSQRLKQLREDRNLTQKDIAKHIGKTRQAIALYELGKREPDFEVLLKISDFFSVSLDYLLGRVNCADINAFAVGMNIDLIRGGLTFKDLSEDVSRKTGIFISPETLELCSKGERMPFPGTISIIAKYAGVRATFFNFSNTLEMLIRERELYKNEAEHADLNKNLEYVLGVLSSDDSGIAQWIVKESNAQYIKLAKEIQESGLPADALRVFIENIKKSIIRK
jgi:transcriptional regulator with XRE-family HTH domain